ncbi:hypothetical protein TRFO_16152 [Tritrichomonas foetus]|uniref:protein-serine/threonine phosphatase n=1 Tax=Tritrichomonas foetus TaxID=1144522 RepID=A0A1J4KVI3_9EUKA|nr:hypothetical protein TRFO_16152 [Tritrichomonas foetus]|eukprot:OHT13702.1 hypothetical protein TRFO_16152 [Tritrichomonas foetus]
MRVAAQITKVFMNTLDKCHSESCVELSRSVPIPTFSEYTILELLNGCYNYYSKVKKINIDVPSEVIIVGDLHGNLNNLFAIFKKFGTNNNYLFLGNIIDYGENSLEVALFILSLCLSSPIQFNLLRGVNESFFLSIYQGLASDIESTFVNAKKIFTTNSLPESIKMTSNDTNLTDSMIASLQKPSPPKNTKIPKNLIISFDFTNQNKSGTNGVLEIYNKFMEVFSVLPAAAYIANRVLCCQPNILQEYQSLSDLWENLPKKINPKSGSDAFVTFSESHHALNDEIVESFLRNSSQCPPIQINDDGGNSLQKNIGLKDQCLIQTDIDCIITGSCTNCVFENFCAGRCVSISSCECEEYNCVLPLCVGGEVDLYVFESCSVLQRKKQFSYKVDLDKAAPIRERILKSPKIVIPQFDINVFGHVGKGGKYVIHF